MERRYDIKRLGIFVFYDAVGKVDLYVEKLLQSILPELNKLVIVVNGKLLNEEKQKLKKYSSSIFIRENIGFDAGAYKDAFLFFLSDEDWEQWNEVVLFNDTFYGPIFPWNRVWRRMSGEKKASFWGLSRYLKSNEKKCDYPNHIQSYFLVCRRELILSRYFWDFWKKLEYPMSRLEATENFEIYFSTYFEEKGFESIAYIDVCEAAKQFTSKGSLYYEKAYELLNTLQFPIVKRKALSVVNSIEAQQTLVYINEQTDYDIKFICVHLKRLAEENRIGLFNPIRLKHFYSTHKKIYIFGYGKYGKNVAAYFDYRNWIYEGFIVSEKHDDDPQIFCYSNVKFECTDGIILALGQKALNEVYPKVSQNLEPGQLFLP